MHLDANVMPKPPSILPPSVAAPAPSSPPASESFLSELDGTAPSVVETSADFGWDALHINPATLNLVSWKLDVNARAEDGVDKRGFNGEPGVTPSSTVNAEPV